MIIRYAKPEDVKEVSLLWERMVKELAADYTPNVGWWQQMADVLMKTDGYDILIAVEEFTDKIMGFVDGFIFPEPSTGKLHTVGQHFYVLPEYRGGSVAARLYREVMRHAHRAKTETIELFCFKEEQEMWARKGFMPVRTLMRKELPCLTQ